MSEFQKILRVTGPQSFGRKSEFLKSAKQKGIYLTYAEPDCKNQIAPIYVDTRELKKHTHNKMKATNTPRRLGAIAWCICKFEVSG